MKRIFVFIVFAPALVLGQIPTHYYSSAAGKQGVYLISALHNIIKNHFVLSAANIPAALEKTDMKPNGKVWDLYGHVPSGTQNYEYSFGAVCGVPFVESDCYSLEYVWPKAWFNNDPVPSTDLFNIYPADGYVKMTRALYPFGTALTVTYTSLNGSKLGHGSDNGYGGVIFEPNTDVKGDIARTYFYMSTRYFSEDILWGNSVATAKSNILPWQLSVLLSWNHMDPVSAKEIARNDSIYYKLQGNRNPFIDRPQFADSIWTAYIGLNELNDLKENYAVFPNPSSNGQTHVAGLHPGDRVELINILGEIVLSREMQSPVMDMNLSHMPNGVYTINIITAHTSHSYRLVHWP